MTEPCTSWFPVIAAITLACLPLGPALADEAPAAAAGTTLSFDADQGTWMGVDLHPGGDRFLFGLLGDVFEISVAGGQAKRLTSGPAWDTEARYSPDGQTIVFSSDRGGNLNLWLMQTDGSRARPLTAATDQRTSDAAWSPDGQYLVTRRRHTDTSSIGTWELWLHDRLGGDGVQLTSKEVQAASEPAFSPDGRFVYYSARAPRYAYNRDPNQGIWQVWRYDRRTGQTRPITGEHGGVVRPTPSPDGTRLAVVRRLESATWLEVLDLATGALTSTGLQLDPDDQEGFGVHGNYPRMDWFPDARHLLVFAEGGFWKVDPEAGTRTAIPFVARAEHEILPAVRPERSPVKGEVQARLVRWPTLSPDGEVLVFGALGSLWRMQVPDGQPERLTRDAVREFGPSWSPDGRWISYVTWEDEAGGSVRIVPRGGGRSRVVSRTGAKYSNPSFSPDGRELVLLRGSGGPERGHDLASELWSDVVILDALTGEEVVVAATAGLKRAARPRFSPDGARVLFPEERPVERDSAEGVLVSVNRDGTDRRDVLKVGHAQDVVPSPDGRWVTFKEHHHAWVARLPEAGRETLELSKDGGGVPVWRLSEVAGDWVDFSGDRVSWGWGPSVWWTERAELERWGEEQRDRELAEADDDPDDGTGTDEDEALPPSEHVAIDLRVPRAVPSGAIAITGARIVTMAGDEVLEGATIVTVDDRIAAVGADGSVSIPEGARVLDGSGTTIIPGLIDAHAHLHFSATEVMPEQSWRYLANLAYGVTTVHDPSVFTDQAFTWAEMVEAGLMTGPRVFSTGQILYGAAGNFRSEVDSLEHARRHVRRMKALGAVSIKSYQHPQREQRQWLVQACREEGLLNIPEGGGDLWNNLSFVLDGHSAIEHAIPIVPLYDDAVRLLAASQTFWTPTLLVAYGGPMGEHYFYSRFEVWNDERLATFTPPGWLHRKRRRTLVAPDDEWRHQAVARQASKVQAAGGHVTVGGHGQLQGLGVHWEMWGLGGPGAMAPHDALRAATIEGARYLGMEAELGSLEPGKLADLVVLERNPLDGIENSDSVRWVIKNGELFDAATMDRVWPEPERRGRLVWEIAEGVEPAHAVE